MKKPDVRTQFCLACEHTKHTCGLKMPDDESFDHPCRNTCSGWQQGFEKGEAKPKQLHGYNISVLKDNLKQDFLWIQKDDGEGMGVSKETLDKFWKDNF